MPPVPPPPLEPTHPDPRPYVSAKRAAAAAETRAQIIQSAMGLLEDGPAQMSMDAVAKAAGVTRLTVYKQFGSRRGLLEAVFDENARRFGIVRMAEAMSHEDPRRGLRLAIEILCDFWGSHPSFARLHDAAAADAEFAEALATRNERRRRVFDQLLARLPGAAAAKRDCSDLIFGMTAMAMFRLLSVDRTPAEVAAVLNGAVEAILAERGIG
jgi:AcrR family transcriptional regulator